MREIKAKTDKRGQAVKGKERYCKERAVDGRKRKNEGKREEKENEEQKVDICKR